MANGDQNIFQVLAQGIRGAANFPSAIQPQNLLAQLIKNPVDALSAINTRVQGGFEQVGPQGMQALSALANIPLANAGQQDQSEQLTLPEQQAFAKGGETAAKKAGEEAFNTRVLGQPPKTPTFPDQGLSQALAGQPPAQASAVQAPTQPSRTSRAVGAVGRGIKKVGGALLKGLESGIEGAQEAGGLTTERQREFELQKIALAGGVKLSTEEAKAQREQKTEFFKNVLRPEPLTDTSQKTLGFVDTSIDSLSELLRVAKEDPSLLANPNVPGNPLGQKIAFLRNRFLNAKLRQESGAAITDEDIRFVSRLMSKTGLGKLAESDSTTLFKLETLLADLGKQRSRILPDEGMKVFVQQALSEGKSKEEVFQFLQRKGMV